MCAGVGFEPGSQQLGASSYSVTDGSHQESPIKTRVVTLSRILAQVLFLGVYPDPARLDVQGLRSLEYRNNGRERDRYPVDALSGHMPQSPVACSA